MEPTKNFWAEVYLMRWVENLENLSTFWDLRSNALSLCGQTRRRREEAGRREGVQKKVESTMTARRLEFELASLLAW